MSSSVIQVRVDDDLRAKAAAICDQLGIDLPTAVRIFLKRTVMEKGIPFSMTLPSAMSETSSAELSDDEKIDLAASRILREHKAAFEELAK